MVWPRDHSVYVLSQWGMVLRCNTNLSLAERIHRMIFVTCVTFAENLIWLIYKDHLSINTFKCIFLNDNIWISIEISLNFVPDGPINNIPALVQIMAWRRAGNKPLSGPMMVSLLTHICVTRPQWVKEYLCDVLMECNSLWNLKSGVDFRLECERLIIIML